MWRKAWKLKEEEIRTRFARNTETHDRGLKELISLVADAWYKIRVVVIRENGTEVE